MKIGFRPFHKRLRVSQISRNSRNKREKKRTHQGLSINEVTNFSLMFLTPNPYFNVFVISIPPPQFCPPPHFIIRNDDVVYGHHLVTIWSFSLFSLLLSLLAAVASNLTPGHCISYVGMKEIHRDMFCCWGAKNR